MRVWLHLGAHKTGTTTLQTFAETTDVARRNGIFIPRRGNLIRAGMSRASENRQKRVNANLKKAADSGVYESAVLSNEAFIGKPLRPGKQGIYPDIEDHLQHLTGWLNCNVDGIVYYIRSYSSFIRSYYMQTINEGATHSYQDWESEVDVSSISWVSTIDRIRRVFPNKEIVIRDFESEISEGQSVFIKRFYSLFSSKILNIPEHEFSFDGRDNAGLSAEGLEILKTANSLDLDKKKRAEIRFFLQRSFSRFELTEPNFVSEQCKNELDARYSEDMAFLLNTSS